jgi:hypothetical protein
MGKMDTYFYLALSGISFSCHSENKEKETFRIVPSETLFRIAQDLIPSRLNFFYRLLDAQMFVGHFGYT